MSWISKAPSPKRYLFLKTVDGTIHDGWITDVTQLDSHVQYSLTTPEGTRRLGVPHDKILYVEILDEGHARIPTP